MPLFFHLKAHFWIFYALFVNGILLALIIRSLSSPANKLLRPLEATIVAGFCLSLGLNGALLALFDFFDTPFSQAKTPLICLSILLGFLFWMMRQRVISSSRNLQFHWQHFVLYFCMFVIVFYNGGLIDQISDAWWHLSLANKMALANSVIPEKGHLLGFGGRYYPPLWHINLGLLKEVSGESLPVLWNAFTAWGSVLKLMAFYLFAFGLFRDRRIAIVSALLFALLPGLGNSYMRVSAWPSHLSYVFLFFAFYVVFALIDALERADTLVKQFRCLVSNWAVCLTLLISLLLILMLHQFELLLFASAMLLYFAGISISRGLDYSPARNSRQFPLLLRLMYLVCLCSLLLWSLYVLYDASKGGLGYDDWMVALIPLAALVYLFVVDVFALKHRVILVFSGSVLLALFVLTINWQHLVSLFNPEMVLPRSGAHERPMMANGLFGSSLDLPGWHLQLRAGLLWSGLVAAVLSIFCCLFLRNRGILFLATNSVFVWLLVLNPYLYQWLTNILDGYHSVWRFALLSFHPAILAFCVVSLIDHTSVPKRQMVKQEQA